MFCTRNDPSARRPPAPRLEQLEDRILLSSSGVIGSQTAPVVQPPSVFQASLSLAIDGAFLKTFNLINDYVSNFGASPGAIDEFGVVPSITTDASARAAAAGVNFNALMSLNGFLGSLRMSAEGTPIEVALADIQSNLPFAGPFGPFALIAGADAALQAVQQPPTMPKDP